MENGAFPRSFDDMETLKIKGFEVNEEAYEMLDRIVNLYLAKPKPEDVSVKTRTFVRD